MTGVRPRPRLALAALLAGAGLLLAIACGARAPGSGRAIGQPSARSAHGKVGTPVASASGTPPGLDGCFSAALGRIGSVPDPGSGRLAVGVLGVGWNVVVLSNESDEDLCSWLPFARRLATAGYRVVVWDYGGNEPQDELVRLVRWLHGRSRSRIVLVGASEGAKASLVAAARLGQAIRGVISLSAEEVLAPRVVVVNAVARLRRPLLLVTARADPYGSAQAAPDFLKAARSASKRLLTVPGTAHGTALLTGDAGATVRAAMLAFLRRTLSR